MQQPPAWQYDEFRQIGTDYASTAEVEVYDRRMREFRDVVQEAEEALAELDLTPESTVLEIGTGTGEFAITAAARCRKVYAADVSQVMLEYAEQKAVSRGVTNIEFRRAGFLTYDNQGEKLDAVVTQVALHHLPDFWKGVALLRISDMLKDGGRFYLKDVVFSFDLKDYRAGLSGWVDVMRTTIGDEMAEKTSRHIRGEYSTTSWIMEGLIKSAGFQIVKAEYRGVLAGYLCVKPPAA